MFLYHCKLNKLALTLQTTFAVYYISKFSYSRITLYINKKRHLYESHRILMNFFMCDLEVARYPLC